MLKRVRLVNIKPSPIRHELTPQQLQRIARIHSAAPRFAVQSLEQFEVGFMRDAHPDREIFVWEELISDYRRFCQTMTPKAAFGTALRQSTEKHPITVAETSTEG